MTKVIICGAFGRMGTTIAQMVMENPELEFAGGVDIREGELHGKPVVTSENLGSFIDEAKPDVMIDFTVAAATMVNAKIAAAKGVAAKKVAPAKKAAPKKAAVKAAPAKKAAAKKAAVKAAPAKK